MNRVQQIVGEQDWELTIEFDPNVGGDGARIRFFGDSHAFRQIAGVFTAMAETVDNSEHPASGTGWHLAFHRDSFPQFQIKNAACLSMNCTPRTTG